MTKEAPMTNDNVPTPRREETETARHRVYDLEERTAGFAEAIIDFAKRLPRDPITLPLIGQLVRAGTSIGADYCEADDAVSRKDFRHRISVCKKESRESKYWLRVIAKAAPAARQEARALWREARELHLIFASIWRKNAS
jgi:four helix bundle protein